MTAKITLTEAELAVRWKVSKRTLQTRRKEGDCPLYMKVSGRPVYELADVVKYEQAQRKAKKAAAAAEIKANKARAIQARKSKA
ncbi:hypothetical protein D3C71_2106050 [compost metagenome]